jgi:hypothetical protein
MLDILYLFYFSSSKRKFLGKHDLWGRFWALIFRIISPIYYKISSPFATSGLAKSKNQVPIIISLTSFPARIDKVWLTIESVLRQKEKADKVLLWLYEGEFQGKYSLPKNLLRLEKRGLEIRFCDENLMPHKKYYYTMLEFPTANVVTIDDDMFYPTDLIAKLKLFHKKYPTSILCPITRKIQFEKGEITEYKNWKYAKENSEPLFINLTMGGGGTMFPPNVLHSDVFDLKNLKSLALKADDLWLKIMSLKNKTKVVSMVGEYPRFFIPLIHEDNISLTDSNIGEGRNDQIFKSLMEHYQIPQSIFKTELS